METVNNGYNSKDKGGKHMLLTYKVHVDGKGYTIFDNGVAWMVQNVYIPFPAATMEESARMNIADLLGNQNVEPQPSPIEELEKLKQKTQELETGLVEMTTLAAEQEQRNIRNEEAIMELTTMIGGITNV